ncbi:MAG: glycosyl hydrolase family 28-related protein [Flavobacteriales bacterium]
MVLNLKYSFTLFYSILFLISAYSQVPNQVEVAKQLDVQIFNSRLEINKSKVLKYDRGIVLSKKASFLVKKGVQLTIDSKLTTFNNQQFFFGEGTVVFKTGSVKQIDVTWFGAKPNDNISDVEAIQKAINSAIKSTGVSVVYFPPGEYCIDAPLFAYNNKKNKKDDKVHYSFINLTLLGHQLPYSNPKDKKGGVSVLKANQEIPFILGIQGARGVHIENLVFDGYFTEKTSINDLIYKTSNELYPQERYTPLSAIVIDPFSSTTSKGQIYKGLEENYHTKINSSRILIENSVIQNFPTGISISPNGKSKQGDSVAINYTRFSNLINGVVMCQAQSRNVVVDNCSFHRMKYAFNSSDFGEQQGPLPEVVNCKFADGVAWIYKANGNIAYGHFKNVYAEGLYGIGYSLINKQPMNFDSCVFKFRPQIDGNKKQTNPCILKADNASFVGCTFTYGGGKSNVEPIIIDVKKATLINCYLDSYPVNIGSNLKLKNTTTNINSTLRKNKIESTSWNNLDIFKVKKVLINYNKQKKMFSFIENNNYKKGDFIFGMTQLNTEPFVKTTLFTSLGIVVEVDNNTIYFTSDLLNENTTTIKVLTN